MKKFEKLYTSDAGEISADRMALVYERGKRTIDASISSYEEKKLDLKDEISRLTVAFAKGETRVLADILSAELRLADIEQAIGIIQKFSADLESDVS